MVTAAAEEDTIGDSAPPPVDEGLVREGETVMPRPSTARSTAVMSTFTAISRVTGFARDWAMALAMGKTVVTSAYVVSNNIPNMVFELVAGGVLSSLFVPLFIERMQRESEEGAWRFASAVFNIAVLALGAAALVGTVWAAPFVRTQMFRVSPEEGRDFFPLAVHFFRFFAIQVVFYGMVAVTTGLLNSYRRFAAPMAAPIFNNIVVIVTLLGIYMPFATSNPGLARTGLAIGTTLGVFAMVVTLVPGMLKLGVRYRPVLDLKSAAIRKMGRKMTMILAYVATNMVGLSLRNAFALQAAAGGVGPATLRYAWVFYQLPYGVFAVSIATAFAPELAHAADAGDWEEFKTYYSRGLRANGMLIIPLAAMLIALAVPLVTLYRGGAFTSGDVRVVAVMLSGWALGLFSFSAYMFTLRSFYSMQDTRTPMLTNIGAHAVQIALYALLTQGALGWGGIGLLGIPLGDAAAYSLHLVWLAVILRRRVGPFGAKKVFSTILRVTGASAVGGLAAWGVLLLTPGFADSRFGFLMQLLLGGVVGLGATYGLSALMRVSEVSYGVDMVRRIMGRLRRGHAA